MTRLLPLLISVLAFSTVFGSPSSARSDAEYRCDDDGVCQVNIEGQWQNVACESIQRVCCKGSRNNWELVARSAGLKCCPGSGQVYDQAIKVCDNGTIRPKLSPTELQCVPTLVFDEAFQKCCKLNDRHGRVYPLGGGCCNETNLTDPDEACCLGIVYRKSEQTCCETDNFEHELYDIPNGACCYDIPYDPQVQECSVNVRVIEKNLLSTCENDLGEASPYNNHTHICCGGSVHSKKKFLCYREKPVKKDQSRDNKVCHDLINNTYRTFFSEPNNRKECRNGIIIPLRPDQELCGWGQEVMIYNTTTDLCCHQTLPLRNAKLRGHQCCERGTRSYDPSVEICCGSIVHQFNRKKDPLQCCGRDAFNPRTHKCIGNRQIVISECPMRKNFSYPERCDLTSEQFAEIKRNFEDKGYYIYVATVQTADESPHSPTRNWKIGNIMELKSGKKKKLQLFKRKGTAVLTARKCNCPGELQIGQKYLICLEKKIKKKRLIRTKEQGSKAGKDVVLPLQEAQNYGLLFQILFLGQGS